VKIARRSIALKMDIADQPPLSFLVWIRQEAKVVDPAEGWKGHVMLLVDRSPQRSGSEHVFEEGLAVLLAVAILARAGQRLVV